MFSIAVFEAALLLFTLQEISALSQNQERHGLPYPIESATEQLEPRFGSWAIHEVKGSPSESDTDADDAEKQLALKDIPLAGYGPGLSRMYTYEDTDVYRGRNLFRRMLPDYTQDFQGVVNPPNYGLEIIVANIRKTPGHFSSVAFRKLQPLDARQELSNIYQPRPHSVSRRNAEDTTEITDDKSIKPRNISPCLDRNVVLEPPVKFYVTRGEMVAIPDNIFYGQFEPKHQYTMPSILNGVAPPGVTTVLAKNIVLSEKPYEIQENFQMQPEESGNDEFLVQTEGSVQETFRPRMGGRSRGPARLDERENVNFLTKTKGRGLDNFRAKAGESLHDNFFAKPEERNQHNYGTTIGEAVEEKFYPNSKQRFRARIGNNTFRIRPHEREHNDFLTNMGEKEQKKFRTKIGDAAEEHFRSGSRMQDNLPIGQGMPQTFPTGQSMQDNFPTAQNMQDNIPTGETVQDNILTVQRTQENLPTEQSVQSNFPTEKGVQDNFPKGQGVEDNTPTGETVQDNILMGQRPQDNIPTGQGVQSNFPAGRRVQDNFPKGQGVQDNFPTGRRIQDNFPTGQRMRDNFPTGQRMQDNFPTGQRMQDNIPPGQIMQENLPTGQRVQDNIPTGQRVQDNIPTGQRVQDNIPTGQKMQDTLPTGQSMQENFPTGQSVQDKLPTVQRVQDNFRVKTGGRARNHTKTGLGLQGNLPVKTGNRTRIPERVQDKVRTKTGESLQDILRNKAHMNPTRPFNQKNVLHHNLAKGGHKTHADEHMGEDELPSTGNPSAESFPVTNMAHRTHSRKGNTRPYPTPRPIFWYTKHTISLPHNKEPLVIFHPVYPHFNSTGKYEYLEQPSSDRLTEEKQQTVPHPHVIQV